MIKKLFTLLTLALLAMPLAQAWEPGFYLVGSFNMDGNNWIIGDGNYRFELTDGIYKLENVSLPDNTYFKIVQVVANSDPLWYGAKSGEQNIHHRHDGIFGGQAGQIDTESGGNDFFVKGAGLTNFSFIMGSTPYQLKVERTPALYIQGTFDSWTNEAMTHTSAGWTISKTISQGNEFRFVDEFGQWVGTNNGSNWWIYNNTLYNDDAQAYNINSLDGRALGLAEPCNYVFNMRHTGDYVLNVDDALNNLVIMPTLATIQFNGEENMTYLIGDDLQVVYINTNTDKELAFAHDLNESVVNCPSGKVDYMTTVAKEHTGSWKQYNWVRLDFSQNQTEMSKLNAVVNEDEPIHKIIKGGTLKGVFQNRYKHYTIEVSDNATITTADPTANFVPNVYCPANFQVDANGCQTGYKVDWVAGSVVNGVQLYDLTVNLNQTYDYWFMTPKPMEVFELSGALYYVGSAPEGNTPYSAGFYMERSWHDYPGTQEKPRDKWFNPAGLKGGIGLNMSCNSDNQPALSAGNSYRFLTVAWCPEPAAPTYGAPLRDDIPLNQLYYPQDGSILNPNFEAAAVNLSPNEDNGQIVTAVSEVKSGSEVVSVTYCDLAGRMSQKPFAGVNIIVTRYSDGTVKTTKAIK